MIRVTIDLVSFIANKEDVHVADLLIHNQEPNQHEEGCCDVQLIRYTADKPVMDSFVIEIEREESPISLVSKTLDVIKKDLGL